MFRTQLRFPLCGSCQQDLLNIFCGGIPESSVLRREIRRLVLSHRRQRGVIRNIHSTAKASSEPQVGEEGLEACSPARLRPEDAARLARQAFRDGLPARLLNDEQYAMYKRLYGEPQTSAEAREPCRKQNDVDLDRPGSARLMRENKTGDLVELNYLENGMDESEDTDVVINESGSRIKDGIESVSPDAALRSDILRTLNANNHMRMPQEVDALGEEAEEREDGAPVDEEEYGEAEDAIWMTPQNSRAHPLTELGKFGTRPSTLFLPATTFVGPITDLLADSSRTHLREIALRELGGPGLPFSPSTPGGDKPHHKPLGLQASHREMGKIEADVFLTAIMPPIYATVFGILVEVRKKLGSSWLRALLQREGGPRILEHGGAGAGILACNQVLKAEWESMSASAEPLPPMPAVSSSTVVASSNLRYRVSRFIDNATFLPRLPDYVHATNTTPPVSKQFDIVIATHTISPISEDHMRKAYVSNLWSLTNPDGGVLILVEKGWPKGFEAIAGARQMLLENYIPSEEGSRNIVDTPASIIAPCTTHARCPMYPIPGANKGRKDICHFRQRYVRPPFLQKIMGETAQNHEDIDFSYLSARRGKDHRQDLPHFPQAEAATQAAFRGFDGSIKMADSTADHNHKPPTDISPSSLAFPRMVLPPLKRRGHIILDLCTPEGKLERWTVPRSFSRVAYRDARKSRWGDLWALGAKTRIPRKVRLGIVRPRSNDIATKARKRGDHNDLRSQERYDSGGSSPAIRGSRKPRGRVVRTFNEDED